MYIVLFLCIHAMQDSQGDQPIVLMGHFLLKIKTYLSTYLSVLALQSRAGNICSHTDFFRLHEEKGKDLSREWRYKTEELKDPAFKDNSIIS